MDPGYMQLRSEHQPLHHTEVPHCCKLCCLYWQKDANLRSNLPHSLRFETHYQYSSLVDGHFFKLLEVTNPLKYFKSQVTHHAWNFQDSP